MYDFSKPTVVKLPEALDEISGLAYYAKDTSVFAIVDEDGLLFKISLNNPDNIKKWPFDKKRDYEDLVLVDSTFYILVSDGDIVKVKFNGEKFTSEKTNFEKKSGKKDEFEILFKPADSSGLVMLCKDCEVDSKETLSSYNFDYVDSVHTYSTGHVYDMAPLNKKMGEKKHLKPSAAAVNPITKELYIVSAIQSLIVVMDVAGNFKEAYKLDPALYKQPEGIAFTPEGDLIISNEFADSGLPTLLLIKNKLK